MFFSAQPQIIPNDPPTVRLMKAMRFGGKDLTANRDGMLTQTQRLRIRIAGFLEPDNLRLVYRHLRNLATEDIVAFTGRVKKYSTARDWLIIVVNYDMRREQVYNVIPPVYDAFIDGETYTIYSPAYWPEKAISAEHHPM